MSDKQRSTTRGNTTESTVRKAGASSPHEQATATGTEGKKVTVTAMPPVQANQSIVTRSESLRQLIDKWDSTPWRKVLYG